MSFTCWMLADSVGAYSGMPPPGGICPGPVLIASATSSADTPSMVGAMFSPPSADPAPLMPWQAAHACPYSRWPRATSPLPAFTSGTSVSPTAWPTYALSAWTSCSVKCDLPRAMAGPVVDWKGIRPVRTAQSTAAAPPTSFSEGTEEYSDGPLGSGPWQAAHDWR